MAHLTSPKRLESAGTLGERLLARLVARETGCLEWSGPVNRHGYGVIRAGRASVGTHRAAFAAFVRPLEPGEEVRHTCDNPPCCNPDHLLAGTHADNMRDMVERGRRRPDEASPKGSQHGCAVLDEDRVIEIRRRLSCGERGSDLAAEYGVSRTTVSDIKQRRLWRHI